MLLPQLPATTAGARAYLSRQRELPETSPAKLFDGHGTGDVLAGAFYILTWYYLTPGQQAAMYHALAAIPGLTVVPHVTDLLGRPGVGIRYHSAAKRTTWTAIFDPTTFRPLGADVAAPGQHNRSAVVPATLVSKLGQRP